MNFRIIAPVVAAIFVCISGCQKQTTPDEEPAPEATPESTETASESPATPEESGSTSQATDTDTSGYQIESAPDESGIDRVHTIVDADGNPVELPEEVEDNVRTASEPALLGDGRYVIYDVFPPNGLRVYDLQADQVLELEFPPVSEPDVGDYGTISPDERHVLAVIGHYEGDDPLHLFVYTVEDGEVTATRAAQINPHIRCYAACSVYEIEFRDNDTVVYVEQANTPAPEGDERVEIEVSLDEMSRVD